MTTMRRLSLTPALLALLAACGLDTPKQYLVPDLRVVAIKASAGGGPAADIDVDETVTLEALVLDPLERGHTLSWYGCPPAIGNSPCERDDVLRDPGSLPTTPGVVALGTGDQITLDLSPWATELAAATDLLIAQATAVPRLRCQLYFEVPVLAVATSTAGDVTALALKRVRVAPSEAQAAFPDAYVLNLNPAIEALETDPADEDTCTGGVPLGGSLPAGEVAICARPTGESRGPYNLCADDGTPEPDTEDLDWQWYVTAGEIAQAGFDGNATANPIDFTPAAGSFTLWTIVRDGRGGTDWTATPLVSP